MFILFCIWSYFNFSFAQVTIGTCNDMETVKVAVPAILTAYSRSINFALRSQPIKCLHDTSVQTINLTHSETRQIKVGYDNKGKPAYFFKDGTLLIGDTYYLTNDYCIQSIRDNGMMLEVCPHTCENDSDRICVNKCCDIDKVIDIYGRSCHFSDQRWIPFLYNENMTQKVTNRSGKNIPDGTPMRNFNVTKYKYESRTLDCGDTPVESWTLRNLSRFGFKNIQFRYLSNGSVIYYNNSKWNLLQSSHFCLDGIQNYGMNLFYTGSVWDQVLQVCPNDLETKSPLAFPHVNRLKVWVPILYGVVMMCSCFLLITTLAIYFLLRNKQKFHMWVVASYVLSLLFLNIAFGTSNILSQLDATDSSPTACILIGAATHLLILSTFIWLTFINLNIWFTFRTLIAPKSMSSLQRHGIRRFLMFSLISWGLPTIVVVIGLILDYINRVYMKNLLNPGYGFGRCLISARYEGIFLFYPIGILIFFNAIIFILTVCRIVLYQKLTKQIIGNSSDKQWRLMQIYMMLLAAATLLWMTEFISWFLVLDATVPYWIVVDTLNLLQSGLIFYIFVCRRNTLGNLEEKYPAVKRATMYFSLKKKEVNEKDTLISKSSKISSSR